MSLLFVFSPWNVSKSFDWLWSSSDESKPTSAKPAVTSWIEVPEWTVGVSDTPKVLFL